jgi:LPS export ABC transporter protein LptC
MNILQCGVVCVGLLAVVLGCGKKPPKKTVGGSVAKYDVNLERAANVVLLYSDSAVIRLRLKAPELLYYNDPNKPRRVFPKGITVDFYDANREPSSKMVGKKAVQDLALGKVTITDSVQVWNTQGERLETDELVWDENKQMLSSAKAVTITRPNEVITGVGFVSNQRFTNWEIKQVKGRVLSDNIIALPEDEQPTE